MPNSITFFGGGHMATAIMAGLARSSTANAPQRICVVDPLAEVGARWEKVFQASWHPKANLEACASTCWILAVKPQDVHTLCKQLDRIAPKHEALILSLAAGIRLATLRRWLGPQHRIVRSMPNMPALIGLGISGLYAEAGLGAADRGQAEGLLQTVGETLWLGEEAELDAVTAVSGSGPAYVFRFIEAMHDAAASLGLERDQAMKLVLATLRGATELARTSGLEPRELREQVTSKGGTTAAALAVMDREDFEGLIQRALKAAARRSVELSLSADEAG